MVREDCKLFGFYCQLEVKIRKFYVWNKLFAFFSFFLEGAYKLNFTLVDILIDRLLGIMLANCNVLRRSLKLCVLPLCSFAKRNDAEDCCVSAIVLKRFLGKRRFQTSIFNTK